MVHAKLLSPPTTGCSREQSWLHGKQKTRSRITRLDHSAQLMTNWIDMQLCLLFLSSAQLHKYRCTLFDHAVMMHLAESTYYTPTLVAFRIGEDNRKLTLCAEYLFYVREKERVDGFCLLCSCSARIFIYVVG